MAGSGDSGGHAVLNRGEEHSVKRSGDDDLIRLFWKGDPTPASAWALGAKRVPMKRGRLKPRVEEEVPPSGKKQLPFSLLRGADAPEGKKTCRKGKSEDILSQEKEPKA